MGGVPGARGNTLTLLYCTRGFGECLMFADSTVEVQYFIVRSCAGAEIEILKESAHGLQSLLEALADLPSAPIG